MIQQGEDIQGALAVRNHLRGIAGSAVAASVWLDQPVLADKLIASGVRPVFQAAATAVQE
jgi:hypothetical protein